MKIFLDTNIWVAAFIARGLCSDLVRMLVSRHEFGISTVLVSGAMRTEFIRIMKDKFSATDNDLTEALEIIDALTLVEPGSHAVQNPIPDPDDTEIVAAALAGQADIFVTGDKPLLALGEVDGLAIVSARKAYEHLAAIQ